MKLFVVWDIEHVRDEYSVRHELLQNVGRETVPRLVMLCHYYTTTFTPMGWNSRSYKSRPTGIRGPQNSGDEAIPATRDSEVQLTVCVITNAKHVGSGYQILDIGMQRSDLYTSEWQMSSSVRMKQGS